MLDDVAPKATGREAKIEKRKEKSEKLHGGKWCDMTQGRLMMMLI